MSRDVHNGQNMLDSRDIITRLAELEEEREELVEAVKNAEETLADACDDTSCLQHAEEQEELSEAVAEAKEELADWDADNSDELNALRSLDEEGRDACSDWEHGEQLISDSYFTNYAEELAEELGYMQNSNTWPFTCIDWEKAAEELKQDYTSVDFDGVTYWIRSY